MTKQLLYDKKDVKITILQQNLLSYEKKIFLRICNNMTKFSDFSTKQMMNDEEQICCA